MLIVGLDAAESEFIGALCRPVTTTTASVIDELREDWRGYRAGTPWDAVAPQLDDKTMNDAFGFLAVADPDPNLSIFPDDQSLHMAAFYAARSPDQVVRRLDTNHIKTRRANNPPKGVPIDPQEIQILQAERESLMELLSTLTILPVAEEVEVLQVEVEVPADPEEPK